MEKELFVDADAFVALVDSNDSNHKLAVEVSAAVSNAALGLVTSEPAFGEAVTVISQNVSHAAAIDFANEILNSKIEIVEVNPKLRRKAFDIFKEQTTKNARFTDSVNIAIMQERGLNEIFSFDKDYKKNGFIRIRIDKRI
ncbi:MAG TPA: PIN domain-containing protein [Candidatus Nanoarchaeia archaeon]